MLLGAGETLNSVSRCALIDYDCVIDFDGRRALGLSPAVVVNLAER